MQVNATYEATSSLQPATATRDKTSADFQLALAAAKQNQAAAGASTASENSSQSKGAQVAAAKKTPAEELAEYLRKTPAQHMRDAILKKMGLTEADLAAMTPEKRAALEQAITDQIKEMLQEQNGNTRNQEKLSAALKQMSVGENSFAVSGALLPATADNFGG